MKLRLEPEAGTIRPHDTVPQNVDDVRAVKFYDSSLNRAGTDEPLLSIATGGRGMRATPEQVKELRDFLNQWLVEHKL